MKKVLLLIAPLILLFCSCNKRTSIQESEYVIKISMDKTETFDLSKSTVFNQFIALETTENSLIMDIEKIFFSDSIIIIFDNRLNEIFLFNRDGSFFRKCGTKGYGPGEHSFFSDVYYDQSTKRIYANEGQKKSMNIYDLNGELEESIPTPDIMFRSFCKVKDGYWLYTGFRNEGYENSVLKTDNNFEIKKGFIPQKEFFTTVWRSVFFQNELNQNFFISPYGNTVYLIEKDELKPYFEIDFGNKAFPFDKIPKMTDNDEYNRLTMAADRYGELYDFIFNRDLLYFSFSGRANDSRVYLGCFNNITESATVYSSFAGYKGENFPFNDITFIQPLTIYENNYIFSVNPDQLTEKSIDYINNTSKITVSGDSNPILFLIKIK
jgi:hypothetical protein